MCKLLFKSDKLLSNEVHCKEKKVVWFITQQSLDDDGDFFFAAITRIPA